jgi:uncharacterized protein YutE (UPF0331/DUF86 family)
MDEIILEQKLESLRRCIERIQLKCPDDVLILQQDYDLQDILSLNLSRAVQLCVDIAAHLIASSAMKAPDTMGQAFDVLVSMNVINETLALRLKKSVGFRNLAVHNYDEINWEIVHHIARFHLIDFTDFAQAVIYLYLSKSEN